VANATSPDTARGTAGAAIAGTYRASAAPPAAAAALAPAYLRNSRREIFKDRRVGLTVFSLITDSPLVSVC
jgi:hypothetical protein